MTTRQRLGVEFVIGEEDPSGMGLITIHPLRENGPTRWGVGEDLAKKYHHSLLTLTKETAEDILVKEYWKWDEIGSLPLAMRLFDISVISGLKVATVTLQLALRELGYEVEVDGNLNHFVKACANRADWEVLVQLIGVERRKWLFRQIDKTPLLSPFLPQWLRRTDKVILSPTL